MVTITYRPKKYEVKIKGRETYDSVSTLFYTLCNALMKAPDDWYKTAPKMADSLNSDTGVTSVKCTPAKGYEDYITLIYETILTGVEMIANLHPEAITLKVMRE